MSKSDIAMSAAEIADEMAELDPRGKGDEPEKPKSKGKPEPEADIEYVGPEGDEGEGKAASKADAGRKPDKGKEPAKRPPEGFVPHEAFHAEREEHKKTKTEMNQLRQQWEQKFNVILGELTRASQERQAAAQPADAASDEPPEWDADPRVHALWLEKQAKTWRDTQNQWRDAQYQAQNQNAAQRQQTAEWNQAYQDVSTDWQAAAAADPRLDEAYQALRQSFGAELWAMGWRGQGLTAELEKIEAQHIMNAHRTQQPISRIVVGLAMARGWRPRDAAAAEAATGNEDAEKANGEAEDGAAEIKRLAKAQDAGDSLSNVGGGAPSSTKMNFDSIDHMSQKEIEAWVRNTTKKSGPDAMNKALARMMGVAR